MEILPIYKKEQMERCKKAGLDPSMIYLLDSSRGKKIPEERWRNVKKEKLGNLSGIVNFLKSVEDTKLKVEPIMYSLENKLIAEIKDEQITKIISYAIKSPSWRERATIINLLTSIFNNEFKDGYALGASAIELAQEAFMIRDDVLDDQERCVNRDTIPKLYGKNIADLGKDILLSQARFSLIDATKKNNLDAEKSRKCLSLLEEMIYYDTLGQWMDLNSENRNDVTEEEYFRMINYTPGTQFKNLTTIAYLLSNGGNEEVIKNLQEFGKRFGMAAQLRDDIIDVIGDEEVVYKKLGTDVLRRKKRLPLIKYLEENPQDSDLFTKEINQNDANKVLENMRKRSGAIPYCISKVRNLIDEGIKYLRGLRDCKEKETLIQTAYLVSNFEDY